MEDEPVDQLTDLFRGIDNICLDVLHDRSEDMTLCNSVGVSTQSPPGRGYANAKDFSQPLRQRLTACGKSCVCGVKNAR